MRQNTWDAINKLLERFPDLRGEAVEFVEIELAALELGVRFPIDYAEYLRRYGSTQLGPYPIFGPRRASPMGRIHGTVVEATRSFYRHKSLANQNWIIFSVDTGGNPVAFDGEGKVWVHNSATGATEAIAESFEAYLRLVCLKAKDNRRRQGPPRKHRAVK